MTVALGDKYVLGELIGSGGMGLVYAAEQSCLARTVAVKLMRSELVGDTHMLRRFHTEALIGSQLHHPNLVTVFDYGLTESGAPYLVMELVHGTPLADVLAEDGSLAPRRAARLMDGLLAGLAAAHGASIVHGDIKTDNLIVERSGDDETLKLIDFGLAHSVEGASGRSSVMSGTPEYLAPEVILGNPATPASDIYGAGVVLYELLTGTTPFDAATIGAILAAHLDDEPVPPSLRNPDAAIPEALDAVVLRALAKAPHARFADAHEFATALGAAAPVRDTVDHARRARAVFATETPTRELETVRGLASARPRTSVVALRAAIMSGDVPAMVRGYLALARALVDGENLAGAAAELEEAIDVITAGCGPQAIGAPDALWRVLLTLAAVYDGLGDRSRARRAALDAKAQAIRCNSPVGRERARALIERLGNCTHAS